MTELITNGAAGLLLLTLIACAGAPVQEMSDARLAIQSAQAAGAELYSPKQFEQAEQYLQQAETQLASGAYTTARQSALNARDSAIRAREIATDAQERTP